MSRTDDEETAGVACDVINSDILVMLRGVRAHLEPKYSLSVAHLDISQYDVAVVHALAAKGEATMNSTIVAVLNQYIIYRTILWGLVSPSALATLDGDGIIIDVHIATIYQHIMAYINIDGIAAGGFHSFCRCEDGTIQETDVVAAVDMIGPEWAVLDMSILDCHVAGIGNVDEARALCILIGALAIPGAANPKFFPIVITIAIDDTRTSNRKAIAMVCIDEGREVFTCLALDTSLDDREVGDTVAPFSLPPSST